MSPAKDKRAKKLKDLKPVCPCCGKTRTANFMVGYLDLATRQFEHGSLTFGGHTRDWYINYTIEHKWLSWACDMCLASGKAIVAKPWLQIFGLGPPKYTYFDIERQCRDCGVQFVFSAKEQQYSYEKLQLRIEITPVQCLPCRKKRRTHNAIQQELATTIKNLPNGLTTKEPEELINISEAYMKAERYEKALEFYRRAKNKLKTHSQSNTLLAKLETLRTQLEAMLQTNTPPENSLPE